MWGVERDILAVVMGTGASSYWHPASLVRGVTWAPLQTWDDGYQTLQVDIDNCVWLALCDVLPIHNRPRKHGCFIWQFVNEVCVEQWNGGDQGDRANLLNRPQTLA